MPTIVFRNAVGATGSFATPHPCAARARLVANDHVLRREATGLLVLAEHGLALDRTLSDALVERLERLCDHLREHFALEEEGGYLQEVIDRRPGLQSRVAGLRRQHAAFLGEGAALSHHLLGARVPHDALARVVRLLEALRRHEIAEHDLLQQAFLDDLGSGD